MRLTIVIIALLSAAAGAFAQQDRSGPFTSQEAEEMSAVWPQIREAETFEQIDWEAVGLDVAPGDGQARSLLARHWDALRQAERFSDINWEETTGYRPASSRSPFTQQNQESGSGPFTSREADEIGAVWPQIRRAETFAAIDWQAVGLEVAPGSAEARSLMSRHWDSLRRAARFSDIDWEQTTGYRGSSPSPFAQEDRVGSGTGPFTRREAEQMSAVWPQIREAETFEDIDWEAVGLDVAVGNAEARRLMATHWNTLRQAERFSDIDWEQTTRYRR